MPDDAIRRPIPGFPGYYASKGGNIYKGKRQLRTRVLHAYRRVLLRRPDNTYTQKAVSALVLLTWVGEKPAGRRITHLDGNKENDCLSNLAYGKTCRERKRLREAEYSPRVRGNPKFTDNQIASIRDDYKRGRATYREIALKYKISLSYIYLILKDKVRTNLNEQPYERYDKLRA